MRKNSKPGARKTFAGAAEVRTMAAQDQIDAIMDSFDFGAAKRIADAGSADGGTEERILRQTARKVLHGALENGGWATGGGFSAFLQEWNAQPGRGALKISLFYGPNSLLEPHTEFTSDQVRRVTP